LVKLRALRSSAPPSDESGFCWEYVTSCIVHAVSRQLERAFPRRGHAVLYQGNATTPRDRPEEDEVAAHTDGFGNNTATLFVHQPYAALRSPAEDEMRGQRREPGTPSRVMRLPSGEVGLLAISPAPGLSPPRDGNVTMDIDSGVVPTHVSPVATNGPSR
jgi:hypothetical protein